jgi:3-oxoacyl-[acyl-carrier protein] reductase
MRELQGNAIVTGASRGIGAHIARALARPGMKVALVARDAAALESVAYELAEHEAARSSYAPSCAAAA